VKKVLLVALVILVVVTGLPVLMGMGMTASCTDCGPGLPGSAPCLPAILAVGVLLVLLLAGRRVGRWRQPLAHWLLARPFERPPRLV
jgi:hypothetical protein